MLEPSEHWAGVIQMDALVEYFDEVTDLVPTIDAATARAIVDHLYAAVRRDANIFVVGNGGSAATAAHFAIDLARCRSPTERARVVALTTAIAHITAVANDEGYEHVFSDQLEQLARLRDVVIVISASGRSSSVVRAAHKARELGVEVISLAGFDGGLVAGLADLSLVVPASRIQLVEDAHSVICHAVAVTLAHRMKGEAAALLGRPAVFSDRDGVLNVRRGDHVRTPDEFEFLPGVLLALRRLAQREIPVIVVTNQACVARGQLSADGLTAIHAYMADQIKRAGGPAVRIYACTHGPEDDCGCRKPKPGLLVSAARDLGLDIHRSILVGDSETDADAATSAGCRSILVGCDGFGDRLPSSVPCVRDFTEAVELVLQDPSFMRPELVRA